MPDAAAVGAHDDERRAVVFRELCDAAVRCQPERDDELVLGSLSYVCSAGFPFTVRLIAPSCFAALVLVIKARPERSDR